MVTKEISAILSMRLLVIITILVVAYIYRHSWVQVIYRSGQSPNILQHQPVVIAVGRGRGANASTSGRSNQTSRVMSSRDLLSFSPSLPSVVTSIIASDLEQQQHHHHHKHHSNKLHRHRGPLSNVTATVVQWLYPKFLAGKADPDGEHTIPLLASFMHNDLAELLRLLLSIDVPLRHLVLILNSNDPDGLRFFMELEGALSPEFVTVVHAPGNLGFSGSCNVAIRKGESISAAWYFILNADIYFRPGYLRTAVPEIRRTPDKIVLLWGYSAFALYPSVVRKVGYFDEVFYPAYWEDIDYDFRLKRFGVPIVEWSGDFKGRDVFHGKLPRVNPPNEARQGKSYGAQLDLGDRWIYVLLKWGISETFFGTWSRQLPNNPFIVGFTNPFNMSGPMTSTSIGFWALDSVHRWCIQTGEGPRYFADRCFPDAGYIQSHLPPGRTSAWLTKLRDQRAFHKLRYES